MYTENVRKMYGIRKIIIIILKRYVLIPHIRYGICNILFDSVYKYRIYNILKRYVFDSAYKVRNRYGIWNILLILKRHFLTPYIRYGIGYEICNILKRYILIPYTRYGICNILNMKRYVLILHIRYGICNILVLILKRF
jgi:hypothetical protein